MVAFLLLFRSLWHILKILFRQEEQTYLDALYFSVMTLATVGYGDLAPQTALGKLFTIIYVLIGVGIITGVIANFSRALAEYHKQKKHHEKSAPVNKE